MTQDKPIHMYRLPFMVVDVLNLDNNIRYFFGDSAGRPLL